MVFWFPMLPSQAGCGRRWHFNNSTQFSLGLNQMSWLHMASLCRQTQKNRDKSPSSVCLLMLPESGQGRPSDSTGGQWGFGCLLKVRETSPLYQAIQFSHCPGLQQKPPPPHSFRKSPHSCPHPWVMHIYSLVTIFPMLYFTSHDYSVTIYLYFLIPSPFSPIPWFPSHPATFKMFSVSMILLLFCLFIYFVF